MGPRLKFLTCNALRISLVLTSDIFVVSQFLFLSIFTFLNRCFVLETASLCSPDSLALTVCSQASTSASQSPGCLCLLNVGTKGVRHTYFNLFVVLFLKQDSM